MAQKETRTRTQIRLDAVRRLVMWHLLSGIRPFWLVSEYPKCGGSWVAQMLAVYLDVPFPRNENVALIKQPPSLLHGHHLYKRRFHNAVYVLRDGRDVMVSAYFHSLFHNDKNVEWAVDRVRSRLNFKDLDDVEGNLPAYIEYEFTVHPRGIFRFSWAQFVDSVFEQPTNVVKYEDLLRDTPSTLKLLIERLTHSDPCIESIRKICAEFSFKRTLLSKTASQTAEYGLKV